MRARLFLALALATAAGAHAKPTKITADCSKQKLSAKLSFEACYRGESKLELAVSRAKQEPLKLERSIDPEGGFDGKVTVDAFDDNFLSLSYDDTECGVALLVSLASGEIVADSGCKGSQYCAFPALPKKGQCAASLVCSDGGKGKSTTEVKICP